MSFALCTAFTLAGPLAHAQADPAAQEVQRQQERERALRQQQQPSPDVRLQEPAVVAPRTEIPENETPCFTIGQIALAGYRHEHFRFALEQVLADDATLIGRCLGARGIEVLIARVQNAIIAQGYVTTRVYARSQDIASGVLTLTVVPGVVAHSLQDTSTYKSNQQSLGGSISVGMGKMNGSISASRSSVDGNYASVIEQSGIRAGDDGFQIKVAGNTDLKGAKIASTDKAVADGKNSLTTQTLTQSEIQNRSDYKAESQSVSVGGGFNGAKSSMNGTGIGIGSSSGSESSTTRSGISQADIKITDDKAQQAKTGKTAEQTIASINTDVSSDRDTSGKLTKQWDAQALQADVQAQAQITELFGKNAAKEIGSYATTKVNELNAKIEVAQSEDEKAALITERDKWSEGGLYRTALHTAAGLLGGGVDGAIGAATSSVAMPQLAKLIDNIDLPLPIRQAMAQAAAAALGGLAGGASGLAAGVNVEANNRQLHKDERELAKILAEKSSGRYTVEEIENALRAASNRATGENVMSGATVEVRNNDSTIIDDGAKWWVADGGNLLLQKVPVFISADLRNYIEKNTGGNYSWLSSPNLEFNLGKGSVSLNSYAQANCSATKCSIVRVGPPLPSTEQIADGAGWVSTQSGRFGSAAAAYGTYLSLQPNPASQAGAAIQFGMAWTSTLIAFGASSIEQILRPDVGQTVYEGTLGLAGQIASDRVPLAAPLINEFGEAIKGTSISDSSKSWINQRWNSLVKKYVMGARNENN